MGKKTKQDPTGQATQRSRAERQLRARLDDAQRDVMRLFRAIPRTRRREAVLANVDVVPVYDYQITAAELATLSQQISAVVAGAVVETQFDRMPPNWWWHSLLETPYRQGTAEEVVEFNRLVTAELVRTRTVRGLTTQRLEIGEVLRSTEYLGALDDVYVRNFGVVRSLSTRTAEQVVGRINAGIVGRKTPTDIAADISKRFDVSRTSASRIAATEVNQAYNDARLAATDIAADRTGYRAGVLHLSALLPATRDGHGERHGDTYTTTQQRQWWADGTNRINCHCSTRTVLIDSRGRTIDAELQEEIRAERDFFDN